MLQPGSKNWINKYFSMLREKRFSIETCICPEDIEKTEFLHSTLFKSGIVFGFPIEFLFFRGEEQIQKWTEEEKVVLLLFESLLLVYLQTTEPFEEEEFVDSLYQFYTQLNEKSSIPILNYLFKESKEDKLEKVLKSKTHIKRTKSNRLWASYIHNSLIYVDVLAYKTFLLNNNTAHVHYDDFMYGVLYAVGYISNADDTLDNTEKYIVSTLLEAANLPEEEKRALAVKISSNIISIKDIQIPEGVDVLYKLYLLDMAVLTAHSDLMILSEEVNYLENLCAHLELPQERLQKSMMIINRFVLENSQKVPFLKDQSSYEELYKNFSQRWIKILGRNKDKLAEEIKESKELVSLVNKSFSEDLSEEEKEKVKSQFIDILKSVPALAIFMLPGGMILLPLILKIVPDLIPSAFKQNEITSTSEDDL